MMTPRTRALALEWLHNRLGEAEEVLAQAKGPAPAPTHPRPADESLQGELAMLDMERERLIILVITTLVQAVPS